MDEQPKRTPDPVPGISLRELIEERNWTALAGLALLGLGLLKALQTLIDLEVSLWALLMLGVGAWLVVGTWRRYQAAGRQWIDNTRNRLAAGAVIALIGLLGLFEVDWWGLLLVGVGAWLGYGAWRRYQAAGRTWTSQTRNRMIGAVLLGLVGLSGIIHLGSAWLLLIIVGAVMIYRRARTPYRE